MTNTITPIDVPFNVYPVDLTIMKSSLEAMGIEQVKADDLYSKTSYLPALYAKFDTLTAALKREKQRLREYSARMCINIQSAVEELRTCTRELGEDSIPDDLANAGVICTRLQTNALKTTRAEVIKLQQALTVMSVDLNRTQTQAFQATLEQDIAKVGVLITDTKAQLEKLDAERQVLTDAIDALESPGLAGIAKDTALTAQKLLELGVLPPQIEIIKLAIDQMTATVETAVAGFNFLALIEQRNVLRTRINTLREGMAAKGREVLELSQRVELIGCFHALEGHRAIYVEQYSAVEKTVAGFIALNGAVATDDSQRDQRFISSGLRLVDYLQPLR